MKSLAFRIAAAASPSPHRQSFRMAKGRAPVRRQRLSKYQDGRVFILSLPFCMTFSMLLAFPVLWIAIVAPACPSLGQFHDVFHNDMTEAFASREYFYIGGQYINQTLPTSNTTSQFMIGQIYVEHLIPPIITKTSPVVLIHGNAQSGTNFLNTPDGREGWASYLLRAGYEVYITDQAARGRSPYLPGHDGNLTAFSTQQIESLFTAPEKQDPLPYPQAAGHSQWPGEGKTGLHCALLMMNIEYSSQVLLVIRYSTTFTPLSFRL